MQNLPTYQDIEKRAYELWEEAGRPHGYEMEFWAQAERELMEERSGKRPQAAQGEAG